MPITEIENNEEFYKYLINTPNNQKYMFVDFYAQWCSPCMRISPQLEELSNTYSDIAFYKVNIDNCQDLVKKYEIKSMPTFLIFKFGDDIPFERIVGANMDNIVNKLLLTCGIINPGEDF